MDQTINEPVVPSTPIVASTPKAMSQQMDSTDFSIIICAYNPDRRLITRCLDAVARLDVEGLTTEVLLVDNNSTSALKSQDYILSFQNRITNFNVIEVAQQGVKYARIGGIQKSRGRHIVYFDYDNEPAQDYLQNLKTLILGHPSVAAWGPGDITVDFIDGINPSLEACARPAFQERHEKELAYGKVDEWQPYYPYGTGLCTVGFILKEYVSLAEQGVLTLSGRSGGAMTSGEDTQMVLLCIRNGYSVGVAPSLSLQHIIPGKRANRSYLMRLAFGTSFCYYLCLTQVFPYKTAKIIETRLPVWKLLKKIMKRALGIQKGDAENQRFSLAQYIGLHAGVYPVMGKAIPWPLKKMINLLKLQ